MITFVYLKIVGEFCKCLPITIAMIMVFHQHECDYVTHWRLSCRAKCFVTYTALVQCFTNIGVLSLGTASMNMCVSVYV